MTTDEARAVLDKVIQNSTSSAELRAFKEGLLRLVREKQIEFLARNYSIQELREMGFDI